VTEAEGGLGCWRGSIGNLSMVQQWCSIRWRALRQPGITYPSKSRGQHLTHCPACWEQGLKRVIKSFWWDRLRDRTTVKSMLQVSTRV
jgi:hypothetical protein